MSEQQANVNRNYLDNKRIAEDAFSELEIAVREGIELARQAEGYFRNNLDHLRVLLKTFEEEHSDDPFVQYHIKKLRLKFGLSINMPQEPNEQAAEA